MVGWGLDIIYSGIVNSVGTSTSLSRFTVCEDVNRVTRMNKSLQGFKLDGNQDSAGILPWSYWATGTPQDN